MENIYLINEVLSESAADHLFALQASGTVVPEPLDELLLNDEAGGLAYTFCVINEDENEKL